MSAEEELMQEAIELSKKAVLFESQNELEESFKYYKLAIKSFLALLKSKVYIDEVSPKIKERYREKLNEYLDRAERISEYLRKNNESYAELDQSEFKGDESGLEGEVKELGDGEENKKSIKNFSNLNEKKWNDVVGLENVRKILQEAFIVLAYFPELMAGNFNIWKGILLYGASGTGKALLAKVCANEANANFFSLCCSDLFLQDITESERLIRNLFDKARSNSPSILFISEIDKFKSNDSESESYRRLKTEFLIQMDGQSNKKDSVLIIASSNTPWNLDPTIRRHFHRRIYVQLPDEQSRINLFSQASTSTTLTPAQIIKLSQQTETFSCSQIAKIIELAKDHPRKKSEKSSWFKKIQVKNDEKFVMCPENDPDCIVMKFSEIPSGSLIVEKAGFKDFCEVIQGFQPIVTFEDLNKFREFTENFGLDL